MFLYITLNTYNIFVLIFHCISNVLYIWSY